MPEGDLTLGIAVELTPQETALLREAILTYQPRDEAEHGYETLRAKVIGIADSSGQRQVTLSARLGVRPT